jgi:ADP-ribose pyrophosphatase YjhB (NUDIX family)
MTLIKRGIEPRKGLWAFPGGFLETGETWKEGGKRECHEEAGIEIDGDKVRRLALSIVSPESADAPGSILAHSPHPNFNQRLAHPWPSPDIHFAPSDPEFTAI